MNGGLVAGLGHLSMPAKNSLKTVDSFKPEVAKQHLMGQIWSTSLCFSLSSLFFGVFKILE